MTATDNNNRATRQNRLRKIRAGVDKLLQATAPLTLGGVVYTVADLDALVQKDIDASDASVQARAQLSTVVQAERASHAKIDPVLRLLRSYVVGLFGDTQDVSDVLAEFGYKPRASTKTTVATKSEAIAKGKATRALRHTGGKG